MYENLKQENEELKAKVKDLEDDKSWYALWHKEFQKQIEKLKTELETYRPTKHHGNGLTLCDSCNNLFWDSWCSNYKGKTYCDDCLKKVLSSEKADNKK